jgi:alpha-ketoglutarate-dependent 2,4-dichlorophenoxyacetate dioxygenase
MTNTTTIAYTPLHPTFIAEVEGVDFTRLTPEVAEELKRGLAKV